MGGPIFLGVTFSQLWASLGGGAPECYVGLYCNPINMTDYIVHFIINKKPY